jgi:hypothetical protein
MSGVASVLLLALGATACGSSTPTTGPAQPVLPSGVSALTVAEVAVPPLPVPDYKTEGTFPQVAGTGVSLAAVNTGLSNALQRDQQRYAPLARQDEVANTDSLDPSDPGVYGMYPTPSLMSASSVVVSALIPDTELFPGGTDSNGWLAITLQVPSGIPVTLTDLFENPTRGLTVLAAATKTQILAANSCVRNALQDPVNGAAFATGFDPSVTNYADFALTPSGLAVGFSDDGQIANPGCGSPDAVVPYATLEPYLNTLGKTLVAGVRAPQS